MHKRTLQAEFNIAHLSVVGRQQNVLKQHFRHEDEASQNAEQRLADSIVGHFLLFDAARPK